MLCLVFVSFQHGEHEAPGVSSELEASFSASLQAGVIEQLTDMVSCTTLPAAPRRRCTQL